MTVGRDAVTTRYGQQVWEFMYASPDRERDDVLVYERNSNYKDEMAQDRQTEAWARVHRAERDMPFALDWAKRVVANGEMHKPWNRLGYAEKLVKAKRQDYDDAYATFSRIVAEGRFNKVKQPSENLRPDEYAAYLQVKREYDAANPAKEEAEPDPAPSPGSDSVGEIAGDIMRDSY